MDFLYLMATTGGTLDCGSDEVTSIMTLVGWVIWIIKIVVPVVLIVVGMIDMTKAVTEKSEDKIKDAEKKLITKGIAAVIVFLVPTLVGLLLGVLGTKGTYDKCSKCLLNPNDTGCSITMQ